MRPRIRTLKPEVWQDEKIGRLSHGARLLFVGLITMADDEGRLRELPAYILGHVFPYDEVSTSKLARWLTEIVDSGIVCRYAVDGTKYLAFRRWSRHQRVDKPSRSELPEPPEFAEGSPNVPGTVVEDSCLVRARASGPDPDPGPVPSEDTNAERAIFDYWRMRCNHPDAKPTRDRIAKIRARRNEGYSDAQIHKGIDGAARAAYVNDAGKRFDDIELICRNGSKLESFIDRADAPQHNVVPINRKENASDWLRDINGGAA